LKDQRFGEGLGKSLCLVVAGTDGVKTIIKQKRISVQLKGEHGFGIRRLAINIGHGAQGTADQGGE